MSAPVWTSLTYSYLSILTSTKMTQTQDNHRAVAHGVINGGTDSGAANAYVVSGIAGLDTLVSGLKIWFIPANSNTGPSTVNICGTGVKNIVCDDGINPYPNDIQKNILCRLIYNAAQDIWQLENPAARGLFPKGYFGGGNVGGYNAEIDGLQFSDETAINPSAVLAVARQGLAGINSVVKGYFGGGNAGSASAEIDGLQFSDETAINPSAVLAVARQGLAGINSVIKGYFGGGYTTTYSAEIDGLQFSDESAINPSAVLAVARYYLAGVQSGGIV